MNPVFHRIVVSIVLLSTSGLAVSQSQKTDIRPHANRVMGDDIKVEFSGVTHEGAYRFTDAGEPRRFYVEKTGTDGRTHYTENNQTAVGDWYVKNDALCFRYDENALSSGCFRVYRVGNCFYYYSTGLILTRNELDRDYWTARSVKSGQSPNCDPGLS